MLLKRILLPQKLFPLIKTDPKKGRADLCKQYCTTHLHYSQPSNPRFLQQNGKLFLPVITGIVYGIRRYMMRSNNIIGYYNPSVMNTIQLLTPLMLCVLILQNLKSISNDSFLKIFHGHFIYSQSFYQKSIERRLLKKKLFVFRFVGEIWCFKFGYSASM